jgi:hypothetical protein
MKVLPVLGTIEEVSEWIPALRQNVDAPGFALTADWIELPGKTLMAEAGQVIDACGPTCAYADVAYSTTAHTTETHPPTGEKEERKLKRSR